MIPIKDKYNETVFLKISIFVFSTILLSQYIHQCFCSIYIPVPMFDIFTNTFVQYIHEYIIQYINQ